MTLYRQILIMILLFFSVLLGVVYTIEFNSTRGYLTRQLQSDVQNTVTTLGLSLVPHLKSGDRVAVESVVNAVFDGGYYQQIDVELVATDETVSRIQDGPIEGVPRWFIDLNLFSPVMDQQVLTSGWLQLGELKVVGHPGYANLQFWQLMSQMLMWFVVAFFALWLLLIVGLKQLLKPLRQLQERSREIENQQFGNPLPQPRIAELRGVVGAFNHMSECLQAVFKKQAEETEELRKQAFQDELTGLGNRAFFDAQMDQWLSEPGHGAVVLMAVPSLEQVYQEEGYQARDDLLCGLQSVFSEQLQRIPGAILARVSVKEFAAILPGQDLEQIEQMAKQILARSADAVVNPFVSGSQICVLGAVIRQSDSTPSQLLSQADLALQQAGRDPVKAYCIHRPDQRQMILGREGWKQLTLQAMDQNWISFQLQQVPSVSDQQPRYHELFSVIEKDDVCYSAGQFMPFVEQFGLGARFDQYVLEQLSSLSISADIPTMINLSGDSIVDADFIAWLKSYLSDAKENGMALVVEIPEDAAIAHGSAVAELFAFCRNLGIQCGIDRFGHYFDKLSEIALLQPSYLKMDVSYLMGDQVDPAFISSLATLSELQKIDIIASRVETEEQLEALQTLPVVAYQGYLKPPTDLK
ncbi:MAG: EAL domain-containing protein [Motiliproteus sp.]|nr:EAL domain-containing protein [Motiliproteus sp.]